MFTFGWEIELEVPPDHEHWEEGEEPRACYYENCAPDLDFERLTREAQQFGWDRPFQGALGVRFDGSLSYGLEINTPWGPAAAWKQLGFDTLQSVLDWATEDYQAHPAPTAGVHCHIGVHGGWEQHRPLLAAILPYLHQALASWEPPHLQRRAYCPLMSADTIEAWRYAVLRGDPFPHPYDPESATVFGSRYQAINVRSLVKYDTVEVRYFNTTQDTQDLAHMLTLLHTACVRGLHQAHQESRWAQQEVLRA